MWATGLAGIVMLVLLLAAFGYVALAARRLDAKLAALLQMQSDERQRLKLELDRVRTTAVPGC